MARVLAGHYDFYFCRDYQPFGEEKVSDVAHILQKRLLEAGVAENQTAVIIYGKDVIFEMFDACKPGDLLVIVVGYFEQYELPDYVREYAQIKASSA